MKRLTQKGPKKGKENYPMLDTLSKAALIFIRGGEEPNTEKDGKQ